MRGGPRSLARSREAGSAGSGAGSAEESPSAAGGPLPLPLPAVRPIYGRLRPWGPQSSRCHMWFWAEPCQGPRPPPHLRDWGTKTCSEHRAEPGPSGRAVRPRGLGAAGQDLGPGQPWPALSTNMPLLASGLENAPLFPLPPFPAQSPRPPPWGDPPGVLRTGWDSSPWAPRTQGTLSKDPRLPLQRCTCLWRRYHGS